MSNRSRSPRRRRQPNGRLSEGNYVHYSKDRSGREADRDRQSGSFRRRNDDVRGDRSTSLRYHEKKNNYSLPVQDSTQNSRVNRVDESIDVVQSSTEIPVDTDHENQKCLLSSKVDRAPQYSRKKNHSDVPREKVLFPSGSDSFYRGRVKLRDTSWRNDRRGGMKEMVRRLSEEEKQVTEDEQDEQGEKERKLFDALVDPCEVPRSGKYFEHDNRDTPQTAQGRIFSDHHRFNTRRWPSPNARWNRENVTLDRLPDRRGHKKTDLEKTRPMHRDSEKDRELRPERHSYNAVRESNTYKDRRHSYNAVRERNTYRDRSPMHWKHDLFQSLDQSPESELCHVKEEDVQPKLEINPHLKQEEKLIGNEKWSRNGAAKRKKTRSSRGDDFMDNMDDLLMDNTIDRIELDV